MCPLRLILIFLSATFAGFLLLKGFSSTSDEFQNPSEKAQIRQEESKSRFAKVLSAISSGFWTCVDMASGRYLWRNFQLLKQSSD